MKNSTPFKLSKKGLLLLSIAAASAGAVAQDAPQNSDDDQEVIEVKGYRGSLLNSTNAKRDSNGFSDEIFADDIGKMPSLNLAESLARIPGVKINRDVSGEGQQIAVRGLGPGFTKIVLNGNSMSVASTGSLDAGNSDRQVDLDLFPVELFSSLSVDKTATAQQIEGGVSGYVNMRTARASEMGEGQHVRFSMEGAYKETQGGVSPKAAFTYSYATDKFGALFTIVGKRAKTRVDGFEQDANFQNGCVAEWSNGTAGCIEGSTGWNNFQYTNIASADYAASHSGVNAGDMLDINQVSGLSNEQLDNLGMPRIARMMTMGGTKDYVSALASFEYKPNEDMNMALDIIKADSDYTAERTEAMLIYRNNYLQYDLAWLPENIQSVDRGEGERIVSGTFYGSRPWVGTRQYDEDLSFYSVMPSFSWYVNDEFKMDISASRTKSEFTRDEPYVLYFAPKGTVNFAYGNGSIVPTMDYSGDLTTASDDWSLVAGPGAAGDVQSMDLRFARGSRQITTTGFHADFGWGADPEHNGILFGFAYDKNENNSQGYSGTGYGDYILSNQPDIAQNFSQYLVDASVTDLGKNIDGYQGLNGIVGLDWDKFKNDINYDGFEPQPSTGNQFGGSVGNITETVNSLYFEINTETEIAGRNLRTNSGVRYVDTKQDITTLNGATNTDYSRLLPSFSAVYDVADDVKIRASASRSLTRANPSKMYPNTNWTSAGIETIDTGNPALAPFEATNFDFGGEYYFSDLGYVGVNYYQKDITGFTRTESNLVQFSDLTEWGVDITDLSSIQEEQLANCGGATSDQCITNVSAAVNIKGSVKLTGLEVIWVQPLDFIVEGLGFNASANKISQDADEGTQITGIADSNNLTVYYENDAFQTRITYYHQDGADSGDIWGTPLYSRDRSQIDISASYVLPVATEYDLTVSFDAYNLTNEPISTYLENDSQTFRAYFPGATYNLGISAKF
ncbi:TonB-dependent receptor [Neptunicella marina]|uniref:TonB-dependent receptor n=1 Tax=Neptunicella marina TaxID=2125989 RepID=A0A8J6J034_9ALTE|nr:TonB-dependent receptor [Neptunicella marina]MBC3767636.1 TonB-dependent receptor [Neptunicella marina]